MIESVGQSHQTIHEFDDIEKHHPTWKEDPAKRHYGELEGKREEFTFSPNGEKMLSKDIILKIDGSSHVNVPSPFSGYAQLNERWGTVDVYEQPNGKGLLIGRVRHMDPIHVTNNQHIEYGEPLGIQNGKNPGKPFGPHAHIDVSLSHLEEFKQYIKDIDSGVITTDRYPSKVSSELPYKGSPDKYTPPQSTNTTVDTQSSLSKTHQSLIVDSEKHVHNLYKEYGLTIDKGTQNTVMCVAVAAAEQGMCRIDRSAVKDGNINVAQMDGAVATMVSVNGNIAANTSVEQSLSKLTAIEQQQTQSINNPSQTIEQPKQGRSIG
jgi:hypothetical protein